MTYTEACRARAQARYDSMRDERQRDRLDVADTARFGGLSEPTSGVIATGSRIPFKPLHRVNLYDLAADRAYRAAQGRRRAIMNVARVQETARRQQRKIVAETPRLLTRVARPLTHWDALDERYCQLASHRRMIERTMSRAAHDGRPDGENEPIANTVNGKEVRYTARWHGTPRAAITTVHPDTGERMPVDWRCYRVAPDGTRTALVTTATAKRRKARTNGKPNHMDIARLQRVAGTIGNVV